MAATKQHFNAAAHTYEQYALWQYQQAQLLWDYSTATRGMGLTLDIGSGTGWIARRLVHAGIPVIAIDNAQHMLQQQHMPTLCADMHEIPLPNHSITQAFCGMTLQWSPDKFAALAEWRRVIQPQGVLFCSVLVIGTFASLHQAIKHAEFVYSGNQFISPDTLISTAQQAGWTVENDYTIVDTLYFESLRDIIIHLRLTGCISHNQPGYQGLTTPAHWQKLTIAYEQLRTPHGLPLEFIGLRMRLR